MRPRMEAIADGERLACPHIGRYTPWCRVGEVLVPGQVIGTLQVLTRTYDVVVPPGVSGRIAEAGATRREVPLGYMEPLVTLQAAELAPREAASTGSGPELAAGQRPVLAQMDGLFYARPSPDEPPYVEPGDTIEPGVTFGLLEVMKFFYPVVYEGTAAVTVIEVVAGDASPVEAGDTLMIVEG